MTAMQILQAVTDIAWMAVSIVMVLVAREGYRCLKLYGRHQAERRESLKRTPLRRH